MNPKRIIISIVVVALAVGVFIFAKRRSNAPISTGSQPAQAEQRTTSDQNTVTKSEEDIVKDLLLIEKAKEQWALENKKLTGEVPTEADLKSHFPHDEFPKHPVGGRYIINAVGTPAQSTAIGAVRLR
jgi:hypothetical protein